MYKTECSQCKKIYETEVKYYNFICGECTRKNKEEQAEWDAHEKERDIATLERLRREMENAIASGDESLIKIRTFLYNQYADMLKEKYGDI